MICVSVGYILSIDLVDVETVRIRSKSNYFYSKTWLIQNYNPVFRDIANFTLNLHAKGVKFRYLYCGLLHHLHPRHQGTDMDGD